MKYIWIFSLLLFPQLSWSIDENITQTHYKDAFDIAIENTCKDHEEPETCETEYKKAFKILSLHALGKTMGVKHYFFVLDSPNTNNPLVAIIGPHDELVIQILREDSANPEICKAEAIEGCFTGSSIMDSIMDYQPQMPERVAAENLLFCSKYYPENLENCLSSIIFNSPENSLQKLRDVYNQD